MDVKNKKPYYDPFNHLDCDPINELPLYNAAGIKCTDAMVGDSKITPHESYC